MNYSHHYHAGNRADVCKHAILCVLLDSFVKKAKPFMYIDTHAGAGQYNLYGPQALQTKEAKEGILKLIKTEDYPEEITNYFAIVEKFQANALTPKQYIYPGSPLFASEFISTNDHMILNEIRHSDWLSLKKLFRSKPNVSVHQRDAYEFLPAVVPPKIKRGLILIDPAYEQIHEERLIFTALNKAIEKFPQGTYVLWYPIKDKSYKLWIEKIQKKHSALEPLNIEILFSELESANLGLRGTGLLILNPPYQIDIKLKNLIQFLKKN